VKILILCAAFVVAGVSQKGSEIIGCACVTALVVSTGFRLHSRKTLILGSGDWWGEMALWSCG
jgi:hypothetical protein